MTDFVGISGDPEIVTDPDVIQALYAAAVPSRPLSPATATARAGRYKELLETLPSGYHIVFAGQVMGSFKTEEEAAAFYKSNCAHVAATLLFNP